MAPPLGHAPGWTAISAECRPVLFEILLAIWFLSELYHRLPYALWFTITPFWVRTIPWKSGKWSPVRPRVIPVLETEVATTGGDNDNSGERVPRTVGIPVVAFPFYNSSGCGNLGVRFRKSGFSHLESREVQFWLHASFKFREKFSHDFGTINPSYRTTLSLFVSELTMSSTASSVTYFFNKHIIFEFIHVLCSPEKTAMFSTGQYNVEPLF